MKYDDRDLRWQIATRLYELNPDEAVVNSEYYIQKLLDILAEIAREPGVSQAFVTEQSQIGDYFMCCWDEDKDQMKQVLATLKVKLGIDVKFEDLVIGIANKLKN